MANTKITSRVIADDAVTTAAIADDAITSAKLDTNIAVAGTLTVTGDITGTLATAAQPNITSVGSLTALDVTGTATMDGLTVDGGATSPTHVLTGSRAGTLVSIDNQSASTSYGLLLNTASVSANSYPLWVRSNDTNRLIVKGNGDISFYDDTGSSQALFWDASAESLGIGTTSPALKLDVNCGADNVAARFTSTDAGSYIQFMDNDATGHYIGTVSNNLVILNTSNVERMRIGSAGNVSIGTTANIGVLGVKQYSQTATTFRLDSFSGSGRWFYLPNGNYGYQGSEKIYANGGRNRNFVNATGTQVGSIQINSGSTAFNTTSDYRLKDNPQPLTGSGEFIDALQPKTWTWNHSDGGTGVGFIAHEAAEAGLGLCVSGEKDEVGLDQVENEQTGEYEEQVVPKYQQVDYSNSELIANMVAELQSLRARIETLEG